MTATKEKVIYHTEVSAHIHSDYFDNFDQARINITNTLAQRILELRAALVSVGALYIEEDNYTLVFMKEDEDGKYKVVKDANEDLASSVLLVSKDEFWWEGLMNTDGEDVHWDTTSVSIDLIEALTIPPNKLLEHVGRTWFDKDVAKIYRDRLANEVTA